MAKIILFDIDYTLFNAKQYKDAFVETLYKTMNYPDKEKFLQLEEEAYQQSKNNAGFFDSETFLRILAEKIGQSVNIQALKQIVFDEELMLNSLYTETIDVLETIAKDHQYTFGIFSAGEFTLQKLKITPLAHFFQDEHIHIFQFKKTQALNDVLKKYSHDEVYLIDDIREILYTAKQLRKDVFTIWIKRSSVQDTQRFNEFIPDATIASLKELPKVLEK